MDRAGVCRVVGGTAVRACGAVPIELLLRFDGEGETGEFADDEADGITGSCARTAYESATSGA